jgi:hypothetical protein
MCRLASKDLPPLAHNPQLKAVLRRVDETGRLGDDDLTAITEAAGNISKEENKAIHTIVDAADIQRSVSDEAWARFQNHLSLEAKCRRRASLSQLRLGFFRGVSGGATGLAAAVAALPVVDATKQTIACVAGVLVGAYIGFRTGARSNYGVEN